MTIDYRLTAKKAIDSAMRGIDLLVSKDNKRPAYAFAIPSSRSEAPDPALYKPRQNNAPALDDRVRAYYSTPAPPTNLPTAREMLHRLINYS